MFIKEVHIDGFGIFSNKHIIDLKKGVNLLYGPNEFGKTTFLEFVRRILFGFPGKRGSINQYPAINGGQYGGKLLCELDKGDQLSIHRTNGAHGGPIKLESGGTESTSTEHLKNYLGGVSEVFYKNVYAFSLNELENVESLKEEDISNRIYGAGLQLGGKSLTDIKKAFIDNSDSLFKSKGSANKLSKILSEIKEVEGNIRDIQKGLDNYENVKEEKETAEQTVIDIKEELRDLREQKYLLNNLKVLFPHYMDMEKATEALSKLDDLGDFPDDALVSYEQLKGEYNSIDRSIIEIKEEIKTKRIKRESIKINEELIKKTSQIFELQTSLKSFSDAKHDIEPVQEDKNDIDSEISEELTTIGTKWTIEKALEFSLTAAQEDRINKAVVGLKTCRSEVETAKIKLNQELDMQPRERRNTIITPGLVKKLVVAIALISGGGLIYGIIESNWMLAIFSFLVGSASIFIGTRLKTPESLIMVNSTESRLREQLNEKEESLIEATKRWESILFEIGFSSLSDEGFEKVRNRLDAIKSKIKEQGRLENRIERMQKTIERVEMVLTEVTSSVDDSKLGANTEANISILVDQLNESKEAQTRKDNLDEQIAEYEQKIESMQKDIDSKTKEMDAYLKKVGAIDYDDLKRKNEILMSRKALDKTISEEKHTIETRVGIGEQYDAFIKRISGSSQESIDAEIEENSQSLERQTELQNETNIKIGELNTQLVTLSSSEDLLRNQNELELKKTKLKELSSEWVKSQIALDSLTKAISEYEKTRQPDVINQAKAVFSKVTNSKYSNIIMLAEENELVICDSYGINKKVDELSRGTFEELYLAMRLGLITEYEKRAESMPFVMDDTFVNFDDDRGERAIKAINDFSLDRQIIVLTCHNKIKELFESYPTNVLKV